MITEPKKSLLRHFFILLSLMLIGLWGVIWFSFDPLFQLLILWAMAISYLAWGLTHHWIHDDLHPKIILEYFLITALGILPLTALLFPR